MLRQRNPVQETEAIYHNIRNQLQLKEEPAGVWWLPS